MLEQYIDIAVHVIAIASIVTAMTKTTSDDKAVNFIKKIVNVLALNIGKNKNADDK
jgi:hypothetical protein